MIDSHLVIWFEELWFDLENVIWLRFDLKFYNLIWNHPKSQKIRYYIVQCHCERQTTILCIEVIGKMSISTNNWICIPASVERLFSTCGAIIRATRVRLTAKWRRCCSKWRTTLTIDSLTFEHSSTTRDRLFREWGTDCRFFYTHHLIAHSGLCCWKFWMYAEQLRFL